MRLRKALTFTLLPKNLPSPIQEAARTLPEGTVPLKHFAECQWMDQRGYWMLGRIARRHASHGIRGDRLEAATLEYEGRLFFFATPEQQRKALEYWKKHGYIKEVETTR